MNTMDTLRQAKADTIAAFLLKRGGWVSSEDICLVFQVEPRELRATDTIPGLCSQAAISGPKGFRHINTCTDEEWCHFQARLRAHGLSELRRVELLGQKRIAAKPQLEMF